MQAGVTGEHLPGRARRGVALADAGDVFTQAAEHGGCRALRGMASVGGACRAGPALASGSLASAGRGIAPTRARHAAQDVHLLPRRMGVRPAPQLASCCRRGISFFGAAGSRKPILHQHLLPVVQRALHRGQVGRSAPRGARLHRRSRPAPGATRRPAAAPPAPGSANRSRGAVGMLRHLAAVDVVVGQAGALGPNTKATGARRRQHARCARAAPRRRPEVARRHRRGAGVGAALERLGQRVDDAARARMSAAPLAMATVSSWQHVGKARPHQHQVGRSPSPSSPAPRRPRCRHGWCAPARSACRSGTCGAGECGHGRVALGRIIGLPPRGDRALSPRRSFVPADPPPPCSRPSLQARAMSQALHPMLNIAVKAARAAGSIINRASLDLDVLKVGSKGPTTS
jgi:uncharacterized low-complexity protein